MSQDPQPSEEKIHYLEPQVIIIDDRQNSQKESVNQNEASAPKKSANSLRFLCVLGLIFCSIFGFGMLLMSTISTVIASCYLFRNANLNQSMRHFWKLSTHTLVAGFGFLLGLISPTIGLGLIGLYFSVTGEAIDNQFLHMIIKRSFNNF